jgi:hypothetical protein
LKTLSKALKRWLETKNCNIYFLRVLKAVKIIEKHQKVSRRWKTGEDKFNAAACSLELRRQESVIETTYSSAVERMFLISLKNKYAGEFVCTVLFNKVSWVQFSGILLKASECVLNHRSFRFVPFCHTLQLAANCIFAL